MKIIKSFLIIVLATLISQQIWGTPVEALVLLFWVGVICIIKEIFRKKEGDAPFKSAKNINPNRVVKF